MKRKIKKQRKIILGITLTSFIFISVGYASFNTNINLKVKGNVKVTEDKCFTIEDNGDGTGTITDYDKTCGSTVKIPNYINSLKITKIADGDEIDGIHGPFVNKGIKKLIISDTLTYIGSHAFCGNNIDYLNVPSNVKVIADHAFAWTGSFYNGLVLNEGLETIGTGAFETCNLTSLKILSTVKNLYVTIASANLLKDEDVFVYGKDENGNTDYTFLASYGNRETEETTIPESVKIIGTASFVGAHGLKTVNIGNNVTEIRPWSFWNMRNLTTVNIGNGVTSIASEAFHDAPNIAVININKEKDSIPYAPWGANATVNWLG